MRIGFLIAGVALAAAIVFGLRYLDSTSESDPVELTEPATAVEELQVKPDLTEIIEPTPASPAQRVPEILLPGLDDSDQFVREALEVSGLPPDWLAQEDLLRRLAVVVDNAQRGEYPRQQLAFLAPAGKFEVIEANDRLYVNPRSYLRYDHYLDVLESVDPEDVAQLLNQISPLLDEALAELGVEDASREQLLVAIDELLEVPVLRGEIELLQPKVFYEYADPVLEAMSPLQKQILRMGPDNIDRLRLYLLELRIALIQR